MLKRNLGSVAMSLAEIIIGILLLVNPVGFTSGIIVTFGVVLMITGIGTTIKYFRTEPEDAAVGQVLVKGLLELLGGAFCAFNSHWFIATFPVLTLVYIAQLVSASDCGSEGRGFESHYPPQKKEPVQKDWFFFLATGDNGIRKAVKKTCRGHVFRPWENPRVGDGSP